MLAYCLCETGRQGSIIEDSYSTITPTEYEYMYDDLVIHTAYSVLVRVV